MKKLLLASTATIILAPAAYADVDASGSTSPISGLYSGSYTVDPADTLIVGDTADGEIFITNGTLTYTDGIFGNGGEGKIITNNAGAHVVSLGTTTLGVAGDADFNIANGGSFTGVDVIIGNGQRAIFSVAGGAHIDITGSVTFANGNGSRLTIGGNSTADIDTLDLTTASTQTFYMQLNSSTANINNLIVNGTDTYIRAFTNAILTVNDDLDLTKGRISLERGSTLDATTASFDATNGLIELFENSKLLTNNAQISTTTFMNESSWTDIGHVSLFGSFSAVESTITTDALSFIEPMTSDADDEFTLMASVWNVTTDTEFANDISKPFKFNLLDGSTFNTSGFFTGQNDGNVDILITQGSKLNADSMATNFVGPIVNQSVTNILVDGANSEINITNNLEMNGSANANITLTNAAKLITGGDIIFSTSSTPTLVSRSTINIGANSSSAPGVAGTIETAGNIIFDSRGEIVFNHTDTNYIFNHTLISNTPSESGLLTMTGGTTTIAGDYSNFMGTYTVTENATERLGTTGALNANTTLHVDPSATMRLYGPTHTVSNAVIYGNFYMDENNSQTLTISQGLFGAFVVDPTQYGTIFMEAALASDNSIGDRIILQNSGMGNINIKLTNNNGPGALTNEGIKLVEGGPNSVANFYLLGDTTYNGEPVVIAGAYSYALYQGSLDGVSEPNSWYLRSFSQGGSVPTNPQTGPVNPNAPAVRSHSSIASIAEAYPQTLQELNLLSSLDKRLNHHFNDEGYKYGLWLYSDAKHHSVNPRRSTTNTNYKLNSYEMRGGIASLYIQRILVNLS